MLREADRRRGRARPPTRASSTRCCTGAAAVGSSWPAATAACTPSSTRCTGARSSTDTVLGPDPARHRQRLRPRRSTSPLDPEEAAALVVARRGPPGGPDRRLRRRGRGQQRAPRRRRPGQPQGAEVEALGRRLGVGYPIGAALAAVEPALRPAAGRGRRRGGRRLRAPGPQVAIGNGPNVGGGTELTPEADPEDGKMDVMISFAIGPFARFGYAFKFRKGEHHEREDVRYLRGSTVSVSGQTFYCSADGEVYGPERHRTWHVERGASRWSCPAELARFTATRAGPPPPPPGTGSRRPSSSMMSATRRRTVRRLRPSARAICSSLAPPASWSSSSRRGSRAAGRRRARRRDPARPPRAPTAARTAR